VRLWERLLLRQKRGNRRVATVQASEEAEEREMAEEAKREFWRWTESNWRDPDLKWEEAQIITVGIDVGSVSSQAVVAADGHIYAYSNMRTGSDSP